MLLRILISFTCMLLIIIPLSLTRETVQETIFTASRVLEALNKDVDPCQDFYEYACGGWIKQNPIPEWISSWSQMIKLKVQLTSDLRELLEEHDTEDLPNSVKKAKAFYRTCLDTDKLEKEGIKPIQQVMEKLNLPPRPPTEGSANFNWVVTAALSRRMLGLNPLISVRVENIPVGNNTKKPRVLVNEGSLDLNKKYFLRPEQFSNELEQYHKYIKSMIAIADPEIDAEMFADDIVSFSTSLAKIMTPEEVKISNSHLSELSVKQLIQRRSGGPVQSTDFDWNLYMKMVFSNTSVELDRIVDQIYVDVPYLKKLLVLLSETKPTVIEKFLWWNVLLDVAPQTLGAFRDVKFEYSRAVEGARQLEPRWKICTSKANDNFAMALSNLYVKRHFNQTSKQETIKMIEGLKQAFAAIVDELDWMDTTTKRNLLKKLKAIKDDVGFPNWVINHEELDKFYEDDEVVEGNLFETYLKLKWASAKKALESIQEKPDQKRWEIAATVVNAFYSPIENTITFPAAVLQPPFYGNGIEAINYGAIGTVIGHEISHGFDNRGHLYDEEGNLKEWWSPNSLEQYKAKVQCIIDQYSKYTLPGLANYTVDGVNTQGDNIADNGGLRIAFNAYSLFRKQNPAAQRDLPGLAEYNPEQLFFLGFAQAWCSNSTVGYLKKMSVEDVHSPHKIRVIGTLSNSKEFADIWKCPIGSPMNPEQKCVLW